jgi:hypothetical protein
MGVWQGVAMDSPKFHPGPPCPTLLRPAGGPLLKRYNGRFRGGQPTRQAACGRLLPLWSPHALRLTSLVSEGTCLDPQRNGKHMFAKETFVLLLLLCHERRRSCGGRFCDDLPSPNVQGWNQARMARGIHGLPKVSPGPAMPNPPMPCGRATPETALWPFLGWLAPRAGS